MICACFVAKFLASWVSMGFACSLGIGWGEVESYCVSIPLGVSVVMRVLLGGGVGFPCSLYCILCCILQCILQLFLLVVFHIHILGLSVVLVVVVGSGLLILSM